MSYRIEVSPNARAGCSNGPCKAEGLKIQKGELRHAVLVMFQEHQSWKYRHWGCVTPTIIRNWNEAADGDMEMIDGYEDLPDELQEKVKRALDQGHVDDEDWNGDEDMNRYNEANPKQGTMRRTPKPKKKKDDGGDEDGDGSPSKKKTASKVASKKRRRQQADDSDDDDKPAKKPRGKKAKTQDADEDDKQDEAPPPKKSRTKKSKAEPEPEPEPAPSGKPAKGRKAKPQPVADEVAPATAANTKKTRAKKAAKTDDNEAGDAEPKSKPKPQKRKAKAKKAVEEDAEDE